MHSLYDLHSHSTYSDGTLTPTELVIRAKQKGVKMLALTDHDSINGICEAQIAANKYGLILIHAAEISCSWGGQTIHITALNINIENQKLQNLLKILNDFRTSRGIKIGEKLEKYGIKNAYQETLKLAKRGLITRTHYGQFLYQNHYVNNIQDAFKKYLLHGKKAYVKGKWADLKTIVETIHQADGLACIAHPKRYKMTNTKLDRLLNEFKIIGGDAIEVVNSNSNLDIINYLSNCANKYQLKASLGSDFHTPSPYIDLGKLHLLPEKCQPVWQFFNTI